MKIMCPPPPKMERENLWNSAVSQSFMVGNRDCTRQKSVLDSKEDEILWDFEIQMDHPIHSRRPDLNQGEKNLCVGISVSINLRAK